MNHQTETKRGDMKPRTAVFLALAMFVATFAAAQIKTLPGESVTVTATVDAIELASRSLTLRKPDNTVITMKVPSAYQRFDALKVGDKVSTTYYDNIVIQKKATGEKDVNTISESLTPTPGLKPGFTVASQRVITATITAIDPKIPSISLSGPNNWTYSSRVADRDALKQVKVGDRLDINWTEAVLLSATAPK
jgi:hypothetical protein